MLRSDPPFNALTKASDRCSTRVSGQDKVWVKESRPLNSFRLCVDSDSLLRVENCLINLSESMEEKKPPTFFFLEMP